MTTDQSNQHPGQQPGPGSEPSTEPEHKVQAGPGDAQSPDENGPAQPDHVRAPEVDHEQSAPTELGSEPDQSAELGSEPEGPAELDPELDRSAELGSELDRSAELDPELDRSAELGSELDRSAELDPELDRSAEPEPELDRSAELDPELDPSVEPEPELDRTAEVEPDRLAEPEPEPGQMAAVEGRGAEHPEKPQPKKAVRPPATAQPVDSRFRPVAPSGAKRFYRALTKRPKAGHVGVGLLVALLGFAAVVQVRGGEEDALAHARRDELLQIYDGLSRQGDRLEDEIDELRSNRDELITSADTESVALSQAKERLRQSEIIAGTAPATGPGIQMTISDPEVAVNATILFGAVQELRSAGAEAIQIEGVGSETSVRVVTDTHFLDTEGGVLVSGEELRPTYIITAIGNPVNLDEAMHFPQGVMSKIQRAGAEATVTQLDNLTVDALHDVTEPDYMQSVPESEE